MSTGAGRPFLGTLREVERELSMPIPDRTRMLRELEFDLESLRQRFLTEGLPSEEASARAVEALVPDRASLRDLGRVHESTYRKLTRDTHPDRLRLVERATLALATSGVVLAAATALLRADLLADPSGFLWPVLGLGAGIVALIGWKAHQLWIEKDHRRPEQGLPLLLLLIAATALLGLFGGIVDTYAFAAGIEADASQVDTLVVAWVVRESALAAVAILVSLTGALAWFVFRQWLALVTGEHQEALGHPLVTAPNALREASGHPDDSSQRHGDVR